jgi:error-prone DNA polymerase
MEDRQIIEWDKDDIDALKFMKVDVLGLGMLGCMNRAFNMLADMKGSPSAWPICRRMTRPSTR